MDEHHLTVKVTSNTSTFAWGGIIDNPYGLRLESQDVWQKEVRAQPIAVKEALALVNTLKAGKSTLLNCRVDASMDSLTFIQAWKKQGGTSKQLNDALKLLSEVLLAQNISLELCYVPSSLNEADSLSCVLSDKDCKLAGEPWKTVENLFGLHTMDLMALDSNVQVRHSDSLLPLLSRLQTLSVLMFSLRLLPPMRTQERGSGNQPPLVLSVDTLTMLIIIFVRGVGSTMPHLFPFLCLRG